MSRPDSERLHSLAKSRGTTVIDVLHSAIGALERQDFLRGLNEDYLRLRDDPGAVGRRPVGTSGLDHPRLMRFMLDL